MKKIVVIICFILISFHLFSSSNEEKKNEKSQDKKIYSSAEFKESLDKEMVKRMKRMGKGKLVEFSRELLNKEQDLKARLLRVEKREEELKISTKQFQKKVKEHINKQNKLLACLDDTAKRESERVQHIVDSMSNMRPKKAAAVLSVQDAKISVKILALLTPVKVAKIFNSMDKEVSARLQKQYLTMKE